MGAVRGFSRSFRRGLITLIVAAVAAAGLAGIAVAPAGADSTVGYTIEVQVPQGLSGPSFPCRLAQVNLSTGVVTGIGSFLDTDSLACANDLAFSPSGQLYGISQALADEEAPIESGDFQPAATDDQVHLVRFDLSTGAVTDLGAIGTEASNIGNTDRPAGGIAFDAAGNLWVMIVKDDVMCDNAAYCFYVVDPANPSTATFKGAAPDETNMFGLTANCAGEMFTTEQNFVGDSQSQSDVLVALGGQFLRSVDTSTGTTARVASNFGGNNLMQSLDFSADGVLWGLGSQFAPAHKGFLENGFLYTINKGTAVATQGAQLSASQFRFAQALAVAPLSCATPEPPPPPVNLQPTFTG
jgi:hypothetical protein